MVAVFSRVPFGPLLLRALLSGVGFAGLSYGAIRALRHFLPELFDDSARPAEHGSDGVLGSVVDIVLPGGDEEHSEAAHQTDRADSMPSASAFQGGLDVLAASVDSGEIEREVADLRADALVASDPADTSSGGSVAPRPSVGLDELDTLPDLDGFSDSFAEGSADGSDAPAATASRFMGVSDSMPTAGSPDPGKDPVVLAKAVQTLLRRDQKGQ